MSRRTRVDVWTVLKELPQRVQAAAQAFHEASQELGFEGLEQELHALFTHAECAATKALERADVDLPYVLDAEKHHRPGVPGREDLSLRGGPGGGDLYLEKVRAGGRCGGAQGRHRRRVLMRRVFTLPREAEEVLGVLG